MHLNLPLQRNIVLEAKFFIMSSHCIFQTHISAHVVLLFHFALLGVQTVVRGTAMLLTGSTQAVRWGN